MSLKHFFFFQFRKLIVMFLFAYFVNRNKFCKYEAYAESKYRFAVKKIDKVWYKILL